MSNADGKYQADGSFSYDYEKISRETGWSVEDIKLRGVSWCRRNKPPIDVPALAHWPHPKHR